MRGGESSSIFSLFAALQLDFENYAADFMSKKLKLVTISENSGRISRRRFIQTTTLFAAATFSGSVFAAGSGERRRVDVCIYAATSGGVIAAVTLARLGHSVLLAEPTRHLGGLTAAGLGWIDFGKASSIGGLAKKYFDEIRAYYAAAGVKNNGWSLEPHVAEMQFEKMLAGSHVEVVREARLASVTKNGRRIHSITLDKAPVAADGSPSPQPQEPNFMSVEAAMFLDCSYEGDLLARAGVSHRTDRESRDEYGESLAGVRYTRPTSERAARGAGSNKNERAAIPLAIDPYVRAGDPSSGLIKLVSGAPLTASGQQNAITQAYNFRLCFTKHDPIPITAPSNYAPKDFELMYRYVAALQQIGEPLWPGDLYFNFGHERRYSGPRLLKITNLMRGKTDVNNAGPLISTDFVTGGAERYANASWPERAQLWRAHENYQRGLFYYMRTEERLPEWLRSEMALWGLPKDEFLDSGGWPTQLYVREARRMVGRYVLDQKHCENAPAREDSIGLGSYALDSHVCQRLVKDGTVIQEGGFMGRDVHKPYPIPYAAITPRAEECENLLVTFCVSSTHVAFASVRMEPPFMIMSESAGFAIDQALKEGVPVQNINLGKLRARLQEAGQLV
jgi:hypothetical protein